MSKSTSLVWLYRALTLAGTLAAVLLVLLTPSRFSEPEDWGYFFAAENFSHGQLAVDDARHQSQSLVAAGQGGDVLYAEVAPGRWAFVQAPGYAFYLVPFYLARVPQLGNILLALGLVAVTYLLLRRLADERAACLGALLLLFTPTSLAMMQRQYMDSFALLALLGMGGGLYILHYLRPREASPWPGGLVLSLAGLFLGLAVATRYETAVVLFVFALHFIASRSLFWHRGEHRAVALEGLCFGLGILLPLGLLLGYQAAVFGSPWVWGYRYAQPPPMLSPTYLKGNLLNMWAPLFIGLPALLLALPALAVMLWQKLAPQRLRRGDNDSQPELPPGVLLLLTGWVLAVFLYYLFYGWSMIYAYTPFIVVARLYLPALVPLSLVSALMLVRQPRKLVLSVVALSILLGLLLFFQLSLTVMRVESSNQAITGEAGALMLLAGTVAGQ